MEQLIKNYKKAVSQLVQGILAEQNSECRTSRSHAKGEQKKASDIMVTLDAILPAEITADLRSCIGDRV
tara:strand:- start:306 stop:512 length:207 start_codon:yes stop_codon:yes gene_type:complete